MSKEEISNSNKCKITSINDDVINNIFEYTSINNLLFTCKEFYKLKKKFLLIELNRGKTLRFLGKEINRKYIYSLIDNPKRQLILNIVEDYSFYDDFYMRTNFDFIFNENGDFDAKYLDILNNVYLFKLSSLSINRFISPHDRFIPTILSTPTVVFNKKYLNFISLNVKLLIEKFIVDSISYDIEPILNNKNIEIKKIVQTPDLQTIEEEHERKQYDLYKKLKTYSEKYSIHFEDIKNTDLIRIINRYIGDDERLGNKFRPKLFISKDVDWIKEQVNPFISPVLEEYNSLRYKEDYNLQMILDSANRWHNKDIKQKVRMSLNSFIKKINEDFDMYTLIVKKEIDEDKHMLTKILGEQKNDEIAKKSNDEIAKQSYDELPKLTESYIKQMNDETEKQSNQKYSENHNRNRMSRFSSENKLFKKDKVRNNKKHNKKFKMNKLKN